MGGTERQQREFVLYGRPAAAAVALAAFGVVEVVRPSDAVERFLVACVAFAAVTVPASWLAARRWPIGLVARAVLVVDIFMVAVFVWALDRESLLVAVYFAPIAFGALMFGPRMALTLGALALLATLVVVSIRDYDRVSVVADIVLLGVLTGLIAVMSGEVQTAQKQLAVDAAALRIAERFRESLDPERVLTQAVADFGEATDAERVRLRLGPQPDGSWPVYSWHAPGRDELDATRPPLLARQMLASREPDVLDVESEDDPEVVDYLRTLGARSALVYPIVWQDEVLAVVALLDSRQRAWRRARALLDRVAPQLATALAQANLFRREQRTAELREELVANVSHELRTPLTATIGFLRTLEREDVKLDPEQRREFLAVSRREAERLARLVSDLLEITRLERGSITVVREPASVAALVNRAVREVDVPEERAIRLDVPDALIADVDGDRIVQVLSNLVANAVRHGEGDVVVRARDEDDAVALTVSDAGPGIAPQHAEVMFEPFARWSRHRDSSGLGLAIARRLVEAHDGTLEYRPRENGEPHAFVVRLPS